MTIEWTDDRVKMLRKFLPAEMPQPAFDLFLERCKSTHLDPFAQQICPVKRGANWTIQVQIHGLRLIAQRTGRYTPGEKETKFVYDKNGDLVMATVYIRIFCMGTWTEFGEPAMWDEFVQTTATGAVTQMWKKMGHVMLAKCSESLGLRRGFPEEMEGMYSLEEFPAVIDTKFVEAAEETEPLQIAPVARPVVSGEARKSGEAANTGGDKNDAQEEAVASGPLKGMVVDLLEGLGRPKTKVVPDRWHSAAWAEKLNVAWREDEQRLEKWNMLRERLYVLSKTLENCGYDPGPEFNQFLCRFYLDGHIPEDIAELGAPELKALMAYMKQDPAKKAEAAA